MFIRNFTWFIFLMCIWYQNEPSMEVVDRPVFLIFIYLIAKIVSLVINYLFFLNKCAVLKSCSPHVSKYGVYFSFIVIIWLICNCWSVKIEGKKGENRPLKPREHRICVRKKKKYVLSLIYSCVCLQKKSHLNIYK